MEEMAKLRIKECGCDGWKRNIYKLLFPFLLPLSVVGEYTGEQMTHCCWCGSELKDCEKNFNDVTETYDQCTCGTERFHDSTGGCPMHGAKEFGN